MKFKLTTTGYFYEEADVEHYKTLGFSFTEIAEEEREVMGARYTINPTDVITHFTSIEQLALFVKQWGSVIVHDGYIEIYDEHRE